MIGIDENSIWKTVLWAYPSCVQIWGAFWLPGFQTATLWSPLVSLWWTSTDSQHSNIFIFSQCLLTGRSCLFFTPCNFPTMSPLASPSRIQHGSAEASAPQTIHPCTETACISSFFPDTTQGSFGKMLTISRRARHLASKVEASKYLLFQGDVQKTFFCTYFNHCSSFKPWLTDT